MGVLLPVLLFAGAAEVKAQSEIRKLQAQIEERNERLTEIEQEIAEYESALLEVGAEKDTLQRAINQLELERKKISADISYTENQISSTDLTIDKLILEITNTESDINLNEDAIREILRTMYIEESDTLVEVLLRQENISEFWDAFESLQTVRNSIGDKVDDLTALKFTLETKRDENTVKRNELVGLKEQYDDQHSISCRVTKLTKLSYWTRLKTRKPTIKFS